MSTFRRRLMQSKSGERGGEFYCDLYFLHPLQGEIYMRTSIFVIDGEKKWGEIDELVDIENRSQIFISTLPGGREIVGIQNVQKDDGDSIYVPEIAISPSDKITIGNTYKFISG